MPRWRSLAQSTLLVAATVLVTEWVHLRFGSHGFSPLPEIDSLSDVGPQSLHDVTESEFERYVKALEAMQVDHGLGVEGAAKAEGMTLEAFREIERRVQRNESLVVRTRESLKRKAEDLGQQYDSRRAQAAPPTRTESEPDL